MNSDPPTDPPRDGTNPFGDPGAHAPPAELDYELVRLIGRGAYGDVWLVRDRSGNYFACKVVYRESFSYARPYEREYEGIQKFEPVSRSNESQVKILHTGRRDAAGYFFYIMELADDVQSVATLDPATYVPKTLKSEIESRKKLPVNECVQLGLSLAAALDNLHQHSLIHRDIKPANIIFVQGKPKLADIGLVTDLDVTVSYVGTEGFIPPEGPKSAQADIYALGKVLYEIATGKDRLEFPELPENLSEFPDRETLLELNSIIIKACESDPGKRYVSARAFHQDLALLTTGKSVRRIHTFRRRMAVLARSCVGLIVAGGLLWGAVFLWSHGKNSANSSPPAVARTPVPDASQVTRKEAELKQTYGAELANGTSEARERAAVELLKRSETTGDPAAELASLRVAGTLAASIDDLSLITTICDRIDQRFEMNVLPFKAELLAQAGSRARTPQNRRDLADSCLAAGFQAIAADDYASATRLASLARSFAQGANAPRLVQESDFLGEESARCGLAYKDARDYLKTLQSRPDDPEASLIVGKFLCFTKNSWAAGLVLLARGNDQELRSVAKTEIGENLSTTQEQTALGNSWWELAAETSGEEKTLCQRRARYWYLKAIAGSTGMDKTQLKQQLAERLSVVPLEAGQVHIESRVGGTEYVDIYSDEVQWRSSRRGTTGNKINHVDLGNFNADGLAIIKNSGVTWLMPDAVDFSTAQLVVDRKSARQGQASLQIADDHVRITLAHQRLGASEIAVTVTFTKRP
jgi:serine/threonine protein kinase